MEVSYIFQVVGSLLLAVVLLVGLLFLLKKMDMKSTPSGSGIRIVTSKSIGPRERLVLVQIGDRQILVGATPQSIQPIHLLETRLEESDGEVSIVDPSFTQILRKMTGKKKL